MFLQEVYNHVSPSGEKFNSTQTLLLAQFVVSGLVALVVSLYNGDKPVPISKFAVTGFAYTGGMLGSNEALRYVSYPTQVLAKSCKLVPVLLVNVLYYRRKQTAAQYFTVFLVTVGLIVFRYDPSRSEGSNSNYGLLLLVISLLMDGITGPSQEDLRDRYKPSSQQFILLCNLWGCIFLAAGLVVTGEGLDGVRFILAPENGELAQKIVIFCICSTVGQNFIFLIIQHYGCANGRCLWLCTLSLLYCRFSPPHVPHFRGPTSPPLQLPGINDRHNDAQALYNPGLCALLRPRPDDTAVDWRGLGIYWPHHRRCREERHAARRQRQGQGQGRMTAGLSCTTAVPHHRHSL
jgi:UDP-galactose transporter B1